MNTDRENRKAAVREIIHALHDGLSAEAARDRFEREVGTISSSEIVEIEQSLIDEGMSPDEIKKFCNVHALLFESAITGGDEEAESLSPAHPLSLFRAENRAIESLVDEIDQLLAFRESRNTTETHDALKESLQKLKNIDIHYRRKEQVLFPYLEHHGFMGPSKVMWGKDDEVRELLQDAQSALESVQHKEQLEALTRESMKPLLEEVRGMIQKEEDILFPAALEKLTREDWASVLWEGEEVGYAFIEPPKELSHLTGEIANALEEEVYLDNQGIIFPSGQLRPGELQAIMGVLPVELTFVGADDRVRYFSEGRERIFLRTRSVIGREVTNCHPPGSTHLVEQILEDFKAGTRDSADFWLTLGDRFIYIDFRALRDDEGTYMGTLEIAQDATMLRTLSGEKRLLDERTPDQ